MQGYRYPGIIVMEGLEDSVDEFVKRIKVCNKLMKDEC